MIADRQTVSQTDKHKVLFVVIAERQSVSQSVSQEQSDKYKVLCVVIAERQSDSQSVSPSVRQTGTVRQV